MKHTMVHKTKTTIVAGNNDRATTAFGFNFKCQNKDSCVGESNENRAVLQMVGTKGGGDDNVNHDRGNDDVCLSKAK